MFEYSWGQRWCETADTSGRGGDAWMLCMMPPSPVLSGRLRLVTQQLGDLLGAVQLSQLSVTNKCRAQYAQTLKSTAKRSLQRDRIHPQWLMAFYFLSGPFWQLHLCSLKRKGRRHSLQDQFNVGLGSTCMLPKCSRVFFYLLLWNISHKNKCRLLIKCKLLMMMGKNREKISPDKWHTKGTQ